MYLVYSATVDEDTLKVCVKMKSKHNFSANRSVVKSMHIFLVIRIFHELHSMKWGFIWGRMWK